MRTKTLILSAALAVAGAATSMQAQNVYSINVVGYVNVAVPTGFSMIANPLDAGGANDLATIIPAPPENTTIYKFNGAGYDISTFSDGAWSDALTIKPGEGAFIRNFSTPFTNTFVGNVVLNSTNSIPQGFSIRSSTLPQAGKLQTDLGYVPAENDTIYQFTGSGYDIFTYSDGQWGTGAPEEQPSLKVGESVFFRKTAAGSWTRNFDPNTP